MAKSEAQKRADAKYRKSKVKRVPLDLLIADYEVIKGYANDTGQSVNGLIKKALHNELKKDNVNIF